MFSIKMTFLPRLPRCFLPGRRVSSFRLLTSFLEGCSCFYATSPRKKHSRRFLSYQNGFLTRGFRSKVTRREKVTGPLLCEEGERSREKCLARITKKMQGAPPSPENSKCPPLLIRYLILTLPSPPISFRCW